MHAYERQNRGASNMHSTIVAVCVCARFFATPRAAVNAERAGRVLFALLHRLATSFPAAHGNWVTRTPACCSSLRHTSENPHPARCGHAHMSARAQCCCHRVFIIWVVLRAALRLSRAYDTAVPQCSTRHQSLRQCAQPRIAGVACHTACTQLPALH